MTMPPAGVRIAVSTIGRFHCMDLARELDARGALATVFSGYPAFKLRGSGVRAGRLRTFPWLVAPYMALGRFTLFQRTLERPWALASHRAHDAWVARSLPECDVVMAQSAIGLATGRAARRRGIAYVCDRGSTHIRFQDRILREEYERLGLRWAGIDRRVIERELAEYELADAITVPSAFVRDSFVSEGIPADKLILAPYGVNQDLYRRTEPRAEEFRVLFAGSLSLRKGLHYTLEGFRRANLPGAKLVLAGGRQPETEALLNRFPADGIEEVGHLTRAGMARQMSLASVMVLSSLEEGLALVQGEALACGCPVIATPNTGSATLFTDGREGFIVPPRDPDAIADRLRRLYEDRNLLSALSEAAVARTVAIGGWKDYANRIVETFGALAAARR